ncbi:MAG: sulfite exporter TauE/SafE family protein, partial [Cyanobacteria bacterium P01_A01_bin.17]
MFTQLLGHVLAIAIGVSLGLIGGGGSILAVPLLVYVMGVGSKVAIAMSLAIVGTVSLVGAIPHWFQGNVNLKTAAVFTPAAMVGAYLGARLVGLPFVSDTFQLICFGVVMVIASLLMIWKGQKQPETEAPQTYKPHSGPLQWLS